MHRVLTSFGFDGTNLSCAFCICVQRGCVTCGEAQVALASLTLELSNSHPEHTLNPSPHPSHGMDHSL